MPVRTSSVSPPGNVTLNGSGSYDPLGEALTYNWTQIAGPTVTSAGANYRHGHLHGAQAGQTYSFRLTVKNTDGLSSSASTTVSTTTPGRR